jgi:small subunit ribosomal protein S21
VAIVRIREKESFERMLSRFKKTVDRQGILQDLKTKDFYEKPSAKRKRTKDAAIRRAKHKILKESDALGPHKSKY